MSALQHTIIRASAGTGKTYQLAHRFLALLLLQRAARSIAPERIVATTFTRKGAGEFALEVELMPVPGGGRSPPTRPKKILRPVPKIFSVHE
mgnify:CR=1 FL=1